jgi:2-polyprenyl-3-methyl-5-hydroxy-6-metoxy-1,4-benzoquinol methylase
LRQAVDPRPVFHTPAALRLNWRRTEHLAACGLEPKGARVLEVGAGIGDLSAFFLDRGCTLKVTDGRLSNVEWVASGQSCLGGRKMDLLDLDNPPVGTEKPFDVVACYGVLHLLSRPAHALGAMSKYLKRDGRLLLETPVSLGGDESLHAAPVSRSAPDDSVHGTGCRPTRAWVYARLREHFAHVYIPVLQPSHGDFPIDWGAGAPAGRRAMARAVFVGSHVAIDNPILTERLPQRQVREGMALSEAAPG